MTVGVVRGINHDEVGGYGFGDSQEGKIGSQRYMLRTLGSLPKMGEPAKIMLRR
jgi:hypothetical protein